MKAAKRFLHRLSRNPIAQRTGLIYKILFAVNFAAAQPVVSHMQTSEINKKEHTLKEDRKITQAFTMNFQTTVNTKKANND
ncbi:MAG: hypothetical protein WCM76_06955 [Bacteroidota bacterium]